MNDRNCLNCTHCIAIHKLHTNEIHAIKQLKRYGGDLGRLPDDAATRRGIKQLLNRDLTSMHNRLVRCKMKKWYIAPGRRRLYKESYVLRPDRNNGQPDWAEKHAAMCEYFDDGGE